MDLYTATYYQSLKLFKYDEQDMQDTAGEAKTNTWETLFSTRPLTANL